MVLQTGKKKEKATINRKNEDNEYFWYTATVALNYEESNWNPERISNIIPFLNKNNWGEINYPSKISDWKAFEKNNPTIALNILYTKEREILPVYISKHNAWKTNNSINDSKQRKRRMALSCSKKAIYIIKGNNIMVIFLAGIVFLLLEQKISTISRKKYKWFWKEKNVTANKRRIKILSRWKSMLCL